MKKTYTTPETEVIELMPVDVIAESKLKNGEGGSTDKMIELTEEGKEYWS